MTDRAPPLALPAPPLSPPADQPVDDAPAFAPVPQRNPRHDGWTPKRQRDFVEALADTGSVASACRAVGLNTNGAYRLRRKPGAEAFSAAWDAALDAGVRRLEDAAMDRALNGVEQPVWSYGKQVGTRTKHNDRLLMFVLRNRAGDRFGGSTGATNNLNAGRINALKAEWKAEQEALQKAEYWKARNAMEAKLSEMHERLNTPLPPGLANYEHAPADNEWWHRPRDQWPKEADLDEDGVERGPDHGATVNSAEHDDDERAGPRVRRV